MKPLASPLRTVLLSDVDVPTTHRVWLGVAARRAGRRRAKYHRALFGAFAVGVIAAAVSLITLGGIRTDALVASHDYGAGVLRQRSGETWASVEAPSDGSRTVDLEDGSQIALGPSGRLATLENTSRSIVVRLVTGRAVFDIRPGGPRRWSVETGVATIEVVGTRFVVQRTEIDVVVEVERGAVLVRGERVPERAQRLEAGNRLTIEQEPIPAPVPAPRPAPPPLPAPLQRPERVHAVPEDTSWRDLATQGEYAAAYERLGAGGIAARVRTADLDQLMALADVARFSGHPSDAVEPLRRAITEHAKDPRAALAAFTLGRLHLDSLGNPSAAARAFREALSLGVPQALVEDAYLRLMEADAKAGDRAAAHRAWQEYVEKFPQSPRRAMADRWGREP